MTTRTLLVFQSRATALYDEQLQRQQQEKALFASFGSGTGGGRLGRNFGRGQAATSEEDNNRMSDSERGKTASFDPRSGEVHGSGADAGGGGGGREDYDQDSAAGSGQEPPLGPGDAGAQRPIDPDEGV